MSTHMQAAEAIRAAAARIDTLSAELAEARTTLTAAEAAVATARPAALTPDAYTMEQVAELLGLSRSTVAELIRRGEIRSVKLGKPRRVFRADLDAYIASVRRHAS